MTREEEITQAAYKEVAKLSDFYDRHGGGSPDYEDIQFAFERGAEWADAHQPTPWKSVEDKLPEEDKNNKGYSVKVIGMFANGCIADCYCSLEEDIWFTDIFTCDKPTYWMPIPELKKGE